MSNILVLLVEDEQTLAMIVKDTLDAQGFDIVVAKDGADGLRKVHDVHPDVLVVDVMMPRMDGFDLARNIRADAQLRDLPIIMLTARADERDKIEGFDIGVDDYIT